MLKQQRKLSREALFHVFQLCSVEFYTSILGQISCSKESITSLLVCLLPFIFYILLLSKLGETNALKKIPKLYLATASNFFLTVKLQSFLTYFRMYFLLPDPLSFHDNENR